MHGYGEFKWADGKKYIGYYINDKKEGFGIYYWLYPLRVYMGFWKNGKQEGLGKFFNGNKPPRYYSWRNGEKISESLNEEVAFEMFNSNEKKYIKFFDYNLNEITKFLES